MNHKSNFSFVKSASLKLYCHLLFTPLYAACGSFETHKNAKKSLLDEMPIFFLTVFYATRGSFKSLSPVNCKVAPPLYWELVQGSIRPTTGFDYPKSLGRT